MLQSGSWKYGSSVLPVIEKKNIKTKLDEKNIPIASHTSMLLSSVFFNVP